MFSVMWVTKLLITPVKKRIFCPKRPNLAQNWHFWSIWARQCRLIRCPVGGLAGGCGAGCSRKTPIYFMQLLVAPESSRSEGAGPRISKRWITWEVEMSSTCSYKATSHILFRLSSGPDLLSSFSIELIFGSSPRLVWTWTG